MEVFLFWILLSVAVGFWASQWNRSFVMWLLIAGVLSPVIGAIILLLNGVNGRKCPQCAEMVKPDALKCKHCGHDFSVSINQKTAEFMNDLDRIKKQKDGSHDQF